MFIAICVRQQTSGGDNYCAAA